MGWNSPSESQLFILVEMLKGRKMRFVDDHEMDLYNRSRKRRIYYVGEVKVNTASAKHAIETGLVKSIGDNRFEITRKGRVLYSRMKRGREMKPIVGSNPNY